MRETCFHCHVDGVETKLVPCGPWMVCPIHSARLIAEHQVPEGYAIVRKPELLGRGVPTLRGKPETCERCSLDHAFGVTYDWANLSGDYANVDDYERMCRSCHRKYDNARKRGDA